mmetsp:Transcript_6183/g.7748  ORF Transcript_6183/g.7748 Transcript_6183/m.7748 type:complete len:804 (+) Transcript_6183:3114-5525(+)
MYRLISAAPIAFKSFGKGHNWLIPSIRYRSQLRSFHKTSPVHINPLLPFDVLEEVQNEELEEKNEKLKKEKKKLIQEKKKMKKNESEPKKSLDKTPQSKDLSDDDFKTPNDTIPLKRAVMPNMIDLELKKTDNTSDAGSSRRAEKADRNTTSPSYESKPAPGVASGAGGSGNGGNGGKGPPSENQDEVEPEGDKDSEKAEENRRIEDEKKREKENQNKKNQEEEEDLDESEDLEEEEPNKFKVGLAKFGKFLFKCLETIGITFSSIAILGVAGLLYHRFYGIHVLDKMDLAFEKGDPAFQLSMHKRTNKSSDNVECDGDDLSQYWVERPQQKLLDDIVSGKIIGRYFLLIGEKGTGKTSLLLESMKKVDGYNVAIFDAHADPEIFRIRLGKALNFTFSEDYIGSLFSIRGPRDTTALLDIERAFSKLEELAIRRVTKTNNRPLVLIINNAHLIKETEEGVKLIELLQQKAESLSGSGLVTIVFNSDDYWVYEKLKRLGTRLELINVRDFDRKETVKSLKFIREKFFPSKKFPELKLNDEMCGNIYDLIGGRPQHISQVARHKDIITACHQIIDREKTWFLNQCGLLGMDMDDDVMESGKFSTSAMLLMRAFVEMDRERLANSTYDDPNKEDHHLPDLPLWRARQIMTRADYIQQYDNLNIFTIDSESTVRADSVPMMRAFHEIASQPHFDELLEDTIERVADIESLGRTREIVLKDLNYGSTYGINQKDKLYEVLLAKSRKQKIKDGDLDDDDDDDCELLLEDVNRKNKTATWKKRMLKLGQLYLNSDQQAKDKFDIDINRSK